MIECVLGTGWGEREDMRGSVGLAVSATAREVLCSRTYGRAYYAVVLVNFVPLVWLLLGDVWARAPHLLALEGASTALLLVECLLKTAAEGAAKYTAQALNVVDVAALALSALLLAAAPLVAARCGPASLASAAVVALRCCAQVLRFLCVFKKFAQRPFICPRVGCGFFFSFSREPRAVSTQTRTPSRW